MSDRGESLLVLSTYCIQVFLSSLVLHNYVCLSHLFSFSLFPPPPQPALPWFHGESKYLFFLAYIFCFQAPLSVPWGRAATRLGAPTQAARVRSMVSRGFSFFFFFFTYHVTAKIEVPCKNAT